MVAGELLPCACGVRCCPLLPRARTSPLTLPLCSSCGEDMEASDGEGEEEVLPPSKVSSCFQNVIDFICIC